MRTVNFRRIRTRPCREVAKGPCLEPGSVKPQASQAEASSSRNSPDSICSCACETSVDGDRGKAERTWGSVKCRSHHESRLRACGQVHRWSPRGVANPCHDESLQSSGRQLTDLRRSGDIAYPYEGDALVTCLLPFFLSLSIFLHSPSLHRKPLQRKGPETCKLHVYS